jgi:hypothetical protein
VYYKHVQRRIFVPKRDGVTGGRREQLNQELHNVYSPPSIIRMIMSRRISWTGHLARMEEEEEEKCMPDAGRKVRRRVTTRKTKTLVFE